jgi:hypothetical protein
MKFLVKFLKKEIKIVLFIYMGDLLGKSTLQKFFLFLVIVDQKFDQ